MKPRAKHRNEVKTRVDDDLYEAMQAYKDAFGYDSDSAVLARLMRVALFGVIGILPGTSAGVSANPSQSVPQVR